MGPFAKSTHFKCLIPSTLEIFLNPWHFPWTSTFPSNLKISLGLSLGKSLRSQEISRASGIDFSIPPEFWWSMNTNPSFTGGQHRWEDSSRHGCQFVLMIWILTIWFIWFDKFSKKFSGNDAILSFLLPYWRRHPFRASQKSSSCLLYMRLMTG